MELEFQNTQNAIDYEKIIDQLHPIEKECLNKAPWVSWRIDNKLFFYEEGAISVRTFHNQNISESQILF